ncbi:MAG TPA: hypothetical protein EYH00_00460 [Archaeoglobus profundus]|nr:hypothetical protein [Archaeoglobus profundus]
MRELDYSDAKVEETLLAIYKEAKRRYAVDPSYEYLFAAVCLGIGSIYLDLGSGEAEKFLLKAFNLRYKLYSSEKCSYLLTQWER